MLFKIFRFRDFDLCIMAGFMYIRPSVCYCGADLAMAHTGKKRHVLSLYAHMHIWIRQIILKIKFLANVQRKDM